MNLSTDEARQLRDLLADALGFWSEHMPKLKDPPKTTDEMFDQILGDRLADFVNLLNERLECKRKGR